MEILLKMKIIYNSSSQEIQKILNEKAKNFNKLKSKIGPRHGTTRYCGTTFIIRDIKYHVDIVQSNGFL